MFDGADVPSERRQGPNRSPPTDIQSYLSVDSVPAVNPDASSHLSMSTYIFACPECGQEIEVNAPMREAILSSGCPVCTEAAETAHFESS